MWVCDPGAGTQTKPLLSAPALLLAAPRGGGGAPGKRRMLRTSGFLGRAR